jgi:hypothetical protein
MMKPGRLWPNGLTPNKERLGKPLSADEFEKKTLGSLGWQGQIVRSLARSSRRSAAAR